METKPYLRKKGKSFIIEKKIDGKTKYLLSLPDAQTLLDILNDRCIDKIPPKASQKEHINEQKESQTFGQAILTEVSNMDALKKKVLTEQDKKLLWELSK